MSSLKDKVVIITGASSGIGQGAAYEFAKHGSKLTLHGRNETNLKKTAEGCQKLGLPESHVLVIEAELKNDEELKSIITRTAEHYGQLDVLVNNAALCKVCSIENGEIEDYDDIMGVNTRAVFYLSQLAVPHLKKTKGSIINISSAVLYRPVAAFSIYSVSKAAVNKMTEAAAIELGQYGIRVNSVVLGPTRTALWQKIGLTAEAEKRLEEESREATALGRLGQVEDTTKMIVFLASDDASFITGSNIDVDGGFRFP